MVVATVVAALCLWKSESAILCKDTFSTFLDVAKSSISLSFNPIMKIINLNPYINIIVSNADKKTYGYEETNFISCKPPKIKAVIENGAGDVMTGTYIYYKSKEHKMNSALSLAVAAGTLYAKSKNRKINLNYKSIKKINNKIIFKFEK